VRHHLSLLVIAAAAGAGAISYSGHARARAATAGALARPPHVVRARACALRAPYEALFRRAAAASGLPEPLLVAVAEQESRFDVDARSAASARGLMQVLPRTAASLKLDAERADENVLAGALYLREMLRRFHSLDLALVAYNAGPTVVERLHRAPTVGVLQYVQNVTARWLTLSGWCRGA
jgi:soluble lytic murein transglycosylase-like protein